MMGSDSDTIVREALAALDTPRAASMIEPLQRALRASPADFRPWHLHGLIQRQYDRRELAIPSLERALQLAPTNARIAHGLARTLFEAGLPSVDAYARALQIAPGDGEIIIGMAAAFLAAGQGESAIAGLRQIVARSPQWVIGQKLLSDLRWANGEREGFTDNFDAALAAHPTDFALRRDQILSLLHAEHWPRLIAVIAEGRRAIGDHRLFDVNEAIALDEMGEDGRAGAMFEALGEIDDSSVAIRYIRHLLRTRKTDEAARRIEPWLAHADARHFWPYASLAWRTLGDERWKWLEGDARFTGVYDIADRLPPLDRLAQKLRALHTTLGQPLEQSVRGGTQTDGNLFHHIDPDIVAMREAIRGVVAEHVAGLPEHDQRHPLLGPKRSPIEFSGAWSVRLTSGGRHSDHVHPMGWISSALYIALPDDLGEDRAGYLTLGGPQPKLGFTGEPYAMIEPKPGRLALFPSTMWHGTRPFADGERLTVAFDVAVPE